MIAHYGSRQLEKQSNPCSWYSNHLALHGLRQVLDLRHGYSMCQMNKVRVDYLECPLRIRTHNIITSSPSSMMRKSIWPSWSYICIYMTDGHYVSSHQNMSFEFIYQKTQKKLNNSKNKSGFGILYLRLHKLLLVVRAYLGIHRSLSLHRGSHLWKRSIFATMERNLLGRGQPPYLRPVYT